MWATSLPWWEFIVRAAVIYVFLMLLLRLTGKRQVGQLAPFDLVLLLVLSNAVQNAMNGNDGSITGGIILAASLVAINYAVGYATYRSKRLEGIVEGRPTILIHDGRIHERALRQSKLTMHELHAALRAEGHASVETVLCAILENNGRITVVANNNQAQEPASPAKTATNSNMAREK